MMTNEVIEAYCVKCREKHPMAQAEAVFTAMAVPGTRGVCPVCGTKMFKMGRTPAHAGLEKPTPQLKDKAAKENALARRGKLVIVESPAKARTIGKFLGKGYTVKASVGHVRDLLRSQLSVDVENDFAPKYRVPNEKRPLVKELAKDAAKSAEVFLATDADREGEAIAWHLMEAIGLEKERVRRVVFHEITKDAIDHAFAAPRDINMMRVDAQQARRVLDRLVGYKISPLLWQRVRSRTSAGRVQSVALRLICEREDAIAEFVPEEYWTVQVDLSKKGPHLKPKTRQLTAKLVKIGEQRADLSNEAATRRVVETLQTLPYRVDEVKRGQRRRKPSAPFITSTLQQEVSRQLGFGARKTMRLAQQLYEGVELAGDETVGLITYMRTDSTNIAAQAMEEAKALILQQYGSDFLPETPPQYKTRSPQAQEAHEAIRPTDVKRLPTALKDVLSRDQYRLYNLIWARFIASQMKEALYETMRVDIVAGDYGFRASGSRLKFAGFLSVYEDAVDEDAAPDEEMGAMLPDLTEDETLELVKISPEQHFTQPPPRYTEASLVKSLEEFGIGRPSTYAPTIGTIQERGYVERADKRLFPTELGSVVNNLVVEHFPDVVNVDFTARMEEDLDKISLGERDWVSVIEEFYTPFAKDLQAAEQNMPKIEVADVPIGEQCPQCGHDLVIKYGRFGKFIACSNFPDCRYTRPYVEPIGVACPKCQGDLVARKTKKGRIFYGCSNYPTCDWTSWKKPLAVPCPNCQGLLVAQSKHSAQCTRCEERFEFEALSLNMTENETAGELPE